MSPDDAGFKRHMNPGDVTISQGRAGKPPPTTSGVATLSQPRLDSEIHPVEMRALVEVEFREAFVEIHALEPDRRLVTTIEVLSPSNKRPGTTGWLHYFRKRQAHLEGSGRA